MARMPKRGKGFVVRFVVQGNVRFPDGAPVKGAVVEAYDKDLRLEQRLGRPATTGRDGRYEITYKARQFRRAEKQSADLRVAVRRKGEEPVWSDVLFNAPHEATLDVVVPRGAHDPSEFDVLRAAILSLLKRQGAKGKDLPIAALQPADVAFIARETGQARAQLDALVQGFKLAQARESRGIPPAAFYGCFRSGLPLDPARLWATPAADLLVALRTALAQRIVPSALGGEMRAIEAAIERIQHERALDGFAPGPGPATGAKLGDLLATMPDKLGAAQARVIAVAAPGLRPDDRRLADKIAAVPGFEGDAGAVARTFWLGALTGGHLPLVRALQDPAAVGGAGATSAFDLRPFARLDADDWRTILKRPQLGGKQIGAPPGTPGRNEDERLYNYATSLVQFVEKALPTAVVASRLASDDGVDSPFRTAKVDLASFFDDNPDFELGAAPLAVYLQDGRDQKLANVADPEALVARVEGLSRVFKLTPRYADIRTLTADGIDSAFAAVNLGRQRFIDKYAGVLGGADRAKSVFDKADRVHAGALNIYMRYGAAFNAPSPYVISGTALRRLPAAGQDVTARTHAEHVALDRTVAVNATWTGLFGSLDFCACEHCASLYSPAAYFVDILRFLDGVKGTKTALQMLLLRRPDLEFIELTCDNSTTPLPYVDLANELLEAAIAPRTFTVAYGAGVLTALIDLAGGKVPQRFATLFAANDYPLGDDASVRPDMRAGVPTGSGWIIIDESWVFSLQYQAADASFAVSAWPQTSWTANELAANPEHVHRPAYAILRQAVYPGNLPFNVPVEEARTYLRHLGLPRPELMEIFFPGTREDALSDQAIAREYLGLTPEDADIITGVTTRDARPVVGTVTDRPWDFWGLDETGNDLPDPSDASAPRVRGGWMNVLRHISVLLHQSWLTYRELLELLGTNFVNPVNSDGMRPLRIVAVDLDPYGKPVDPGTCQLSLLTLQGLDADVKPALARMHRFVRLWRKLGNVGWTARELDQAITAFDPQGWQTGLTDAFITRLSHVARLRAAFGLPVVELLSWWSNIDTAAYVDHLAEGEPPVPSLYQQLFRNKAVINPLDDAFTDDPGGLAGTIGGHVPAIVATLGIGAADLSRLVTGPDAVITTDTLDLGNLSQLYRTASLARALKLSIRELRAIASLSGLDPFTGITPILPTGATLRFVDIVGAIRDSGFSIDELAYLLRQDLQPSSALAPSEESLAVTLDELRSALQQIAAETELPSTDRNGDVTRRDLALLGWDARLIDDVVAAFAGTATYEVETIAFPNPLVLPNDTGNYAVTLASSPAGLTFPRELEGVVRIDPTFLFSCDPTIPVETAAGGVISTALRQKFRDNQIMLPANAPVITGVPDTLFTIAGRYSVVKNGGVLGVYDLKALTLRASRLLGGAERSLLAHLSTDADFANAVDNLLRVQDELQGRITYEEVTVGGQRAGRLRFVGPMTGTRKSRLETVSNDSNYRQPLQALFDAPRELVARDARTFAVHDFTADLPALPAVAFPPALTRKIYFDGTSTPPRLHFIGVMTPAEREALLALSTDLSYRDAVKALFAQAEPDDVGELDPAPYDVFLTRADTALLFDAPSDPDARFLRVLGKLMPYVRTLRGERAIVQRLADTLQLEASTTKDLLTRWIESPTQPGQRAIAEFRAQAFAASNPNAPITAAAFPDQFATLGLLYKVALIVKKLKPTPRQLAWLFDQGAGGGWLDLNSLPVTPLPATTSSAAAFTGWRRLCDLFRVRAALPFGEMGLFDLFDAALAATAATAAKRNTAKAAYLDDLWRLTQWSVDDLVSLLGTANDTQARGALAFTFPDDYADERIIDRLRECVRRMKRLGASAADAIDWAKTAPTPDAEAAAAIAIKNAAKSKHSDAEWLTVAKPLKAPLREKQRAALVSYLVAHPDPARGQTWTDVDELYEYLLVDVQMDACMTSTRLLQATLSVQLFIQRCLMNLEIGVLFTPDEVRQWTGWRKQYRLWEANRKVLFYPENWILPELRDDKSPFFEELESELSANELTADTAEDAFLHYLEKVDQVGRLEIVGMYQQLEPANPARQLDAVDVLHVFGRTAAVPHQYFYRRLSKGVWSAWERIDLDIEGDHLMPVVWNRRLHLFWAVLTEKEDRQDKAQRTAGDDPTKYWEIKLAWSEYKNKGWSPKRLSKEWLRQNQHLFPQDPTNPLNVLQETSDLSFKSGSVAGELIVSCFGGALAPHTNEETTVTPAPALPELTWSVFTVVSHRNFLGGREPTFLTCRFTVNGATPTAEQRTRIHLQFRDPRGGAPEPTPPLDIHTNGDVRSGPFVTDDLLVEAVTKGFTVLSTVELGSWWATNPGAYFDQIIETLNDEIADLVADVNSGFTKQAADDLLATLRDVIPGLIGTVVGSGGTLIPAVLATLTAIVGAAFAALSGVVTAAAARVFGRRVIVDLAPLPEPQPTITTTTTVTYSLERMQFLGEFILDDESSALRAVDRTHFLGSSHLDPLPGAPIQNMMFVEETGPSDHALAVGIDARGAQIQLLQTTPGIFRVLAPAQYPQFDLNHPFFFQDGRRVYLVRFGDQFDFTIHFHPRIGELIKTLKREGVPGLLRLPPVRPTDNGTTFMGVYHPTPIYVPYLSPASVPNEDIDFTCPGAYSLYNWELFFQVPFLIANQLSRNQRFAESQRWFHYIFDPTATDSPVNPAQPGVECFWRVQPFYDRALKPIQTLEELLKDTSQIDQQIAAWQQNPFKPHVIARLRIVAYMKAIVMRYLDNLIAWGDRLFRQDTMETINEATQLYVLAAQILGRRPEDIPARARPKAQTFRTLDDRGALSDLANAVVAIETFLPPSAAPGPIGGTSGGGLLMPFFCITANDQLLGYWDTIADRLFKIRHCMNIEGVERALPLFQPPLDPALLVRAAAAGVDIASMLADLTAPRPHYRFSVMLQKATELCNDVKSLGAALLAALEKKDAEELALLRSRHEVALLQAMRDTRKKQVDEANQTLAGLQRYKDVVTARQDYYRSRPFTIAEEQTHLALQQASLIPLGLQAGAEVLAAIMHLIPDAKLGFFTTAGTTYGGSNIASGIQASGSAAATAASILNTIGSLNATLGGYRRRQDDWTHQADLATKELGQVEKQISAAEVRVAIAEQELASHDLQIDNAKEVDAYLRDGKFTNQQLYSYMVGQISSVYFQGYQLAYDVAKRAERTFRYELGLRDSSFIQFGYWDSLKKGLLCGERLHHDLKRMDVAYLDQNAREYEITKHVSLQMIDPVALITLRETGDCFVTLPESLFDLDHPGHYMRRLKSVSITIPCVTGPYAGINCTLTQLQSSVRHNNTLLAGKYARKGDDDGRFSDIFGTIQSIVTSQGQNDSGLFDANLRDERYLPFEGQGAIGTWRIQLPTQFRTFDHDTISDVVLHVRYTAREGGELLRQQAASELTAALDRFVQSDGALGLVRAFSLRHEFPTEWQRFLNPSPVGTGGAGAASGADQTLTLPLNRELFPFQFQDRIASITEFELYVQVNSGFAESHNEATLKLAFEPGKRTSTAALNVEALSGLLHAVKSPAGPLGDWTLTAWLDGNPHLRLDPHAIRDVLLVCRYKCA
jgi:Tc toxin complex TcA C-terminal TcB-binding domain/ABC toxin N-terminal region/Neuraminidase-like domain